MRPASRRILKCCDKVDLGSFKLPLDKKAEQFMAQYQVSRLVVTDDDDVLVGVISLSDIAEVEPARRAARTLRSVAAREAPTSH